MSESVIGNMTDLVNEFNDVKEDVNTTVSGVMKNISDIYDNTKTYDVEDYVIFNNVIYKCIIAVETSEDFDDSKWEDTTVTKIVSSVKDNGGLKIIGEIISYMGTSAPDNFLVCDGSSYNIDDYPLLAKHILDNFGSYSYFGGDGTDTFAVPNMVGRYALPSSDVDTIGTKVEAGLPNITGSVGLGAAIVSYNSEQRFTGSGAFQQTSCSHTHRAITSGSTAVVITDNNVAYTSFNASASNSLYGKSSTVTPASIRVLSCIRYK